MYICLSVCLPPSALGGPSGNPHAALSGLEQGLLRSCFLNLGMRMYRPPLPILHASALFGLLTRNGGGESAHSRIPKFMKQYARGLSLYNITYICTYIPRVRVLHVLLHMRMLCCCMCSS